MKTIKVLNAHENFSNKNSKNLNNNDNNNKSNNNEKIIIIIIINNPA